jgi:signal transduction histidine kinase
MFPLYPRTTPRQVLIKKGRAIVKKLILSIVSCLFVATPIHAQGYGVGTPVEAKNMVEKAVAYIQANGAERALKEICTPNGKFQWRDLYVFAYDLEGVMIGHPNQELVGKNLYRVPDSKGKLFRKEIIDLARIRNSGWIDYTYKNPMTEREEFKITYFRKEGNLIICCGAYLP